MKHFASISKSISNSVTSGGSPSLVQCQTTTSLREKSRFFLVSCIGLFSLLAAPLHGILLRGAALRGKRPARDELPLDFVQYTTRRRSEEKNVGYRALHLTRYPNPSFCMTRILRLPPSTRGRLLKESSTTIKSDENITHMTKTHTGKL